MPILIENKYLNQIKVCLAFPKEDNLLLDDSQIKELCVEPALREYFTKFPIRETQSVYKGTDSSVTVPFPDNYTFGVVDCRMVDVGNTTFGTGSDFWNIVAFNTFGGGNVTTNGKYGSAYGQPNYNPNGLLETRELYRNRMKSNQNQYTTIKFIPDFNKREVYVYSNQCGNVNITWTKFSEDFSSVKFQYINDVVDLAKARLMNHFADTAGIITDSNLEITINVDALTSKATELRDKVIEKWSAIPDVIYIHAV